MAILVTQLRPEELASVIDFAKTSGCTMESEDVDTHVSLLAKDGDTIVAAVLGLASSGRTCELNVCMGKTDAEAKDEVSAESGALAGELINKALMKVHGAGIRRCRINHHGDSGTPSNWPSSPWTGQEDTEAA